MAKVSARNAHQVAAVNGSQPSDDPVVAANEIRMVLRSDGHVLIARRPAYPKGSLYRTPSWQYKDGGKPDLGVGDSDLEWAQSFQAKAERYMTRRGYHVVKAEGRKY